MASAEDVTLGHNIGIFDCHRINAKACLSFLSRCSDIMRPQSIQMRLTDGDNLLQPAALKQVYQQYLPFRTMLGFSKVRC